MIKKGFNMARGEVSLEALMDYEIEACLASVSTKERQESLKDFEQRTGLCPVESTAFAGALLYTKYNFLNRGLMKSITQKEGGDIDTSRDFIYTDWDAVDNFANLFLSRLA